MNAISVIMPCYNRDFDLLRVLQAYDQQTTNSLFEVIAIDDASSDKTFEILNAYRPQNYTLKVFRQEKNQGPAAARNRGIQAASAPLLLFVGDDILPSPDFIALHLAAHQNADEHTAILGRTVWPVDITLNSLMTYIDGIGAQQFSYYYLRDGQEYDFRHFYTSNVSIKTSFLKSLPVWFDTDFVYAAFEDAELAYRLSLRGLKIIYHAEIVAHHYHYHTLWTFTRRQFLAGQMACVLVRKHPELFTFIVGKNTKTRLLFLRLRTLMMRLDINLQEYEKMAISQASASESLQQPDMARQYQRLLEYFYMKGIIYGMFPETIALKITKLYAQNQLKLLELK